MPAITPNLWFDHQAEEAAEFYCSIFPSSSIDQILRYTEAGPGEPGSVLTVDFTLDGTRFTALNGGPQFTFDEAVSFLIECADQAEIDRYWEALTADGGEEGHCGWLKDRYGVSWQVATKGMEELLAGPDEERAARATRALYGMKKIDLAAIYAAADGA